MTVYCVAMHGDQVDREECQDSDEDQSSNTLLVRDLDKLTSLPDDPLVTPQHDATSNQYADLVQEFAAGEKTSQAVDDELAKLIEKLINNKLPKTKLDYLHAQYLRPENCKFLVAPKANEAIWNQFKDHTRKVDVGMQKCRALFLRRRMQSWKHSARL